MNRFPTKKKKEKTYCITSLGLTFGQTLKAMCSIALAAKPTRVTIRSLTLVMDWCSQMNFHLTLGILLLLIMWLDSSWLRMLTFMCTMQLYNAFAVLVDALTKYTVIVPCTKKRCWLGSHVQGPCTCSLWTAWAYTMELSDRGTQCTGRFNQVLAERLGYNCKVTPAHTPWWWSDWACKQADWRCTATVCICRHAGLGQASQPGAVCHQQCMAWDCARDFHVPESWQTPQVPVAIDGATARLFCWWLCISNACSDC